MKRTLAEGAEGVRPLTFAIGKKIGTNYRRDLHITLNVIGL